MSEKPGPHERPPVGPAAALAQRLSDRIPVLETARLRLRAPRITDFRIYARIACSQRARFMGGPMTREEAWDDCTHVQCLALAWPWCVDHGGEGGWRAVGGGCAGV